MAVDRSTQWIFTYIFQSKTGPKQCLRLTESAADSHWVILTLGHEQIDERGTQRQAYDL